MDDECIQHDDYPSDDEAGDHGHKSISVPSSPSCTASSLPSQHLSLSCHTPPNQVLRPSASAASSAVPPDALPLLAPRPLPPVRSPSIYQAPSVRSGLPAQSSHTYRRSHLTRPVLPSSAISNVVPSQHTSLSQLPVPSSEGVLSTSSSRSEMSSASPDSSAPFLSPSSHPRSGMSMSSASQGSSSLPFLSPDATPRTPRSDSSMTSVKESWSKFATNTSYTNTIEEVYQCHLPASVKELFLATAYQPLAKRQAVSKVTQDLAMAANTKTKAKSALSEAASCINLHGTPSQNKVAYSDNHERESMCVVCMCDLIFVMSHVLLLLQLVLNTCAYLIHRKFDAALDPPELSRDYQDPAFDPKMYDTEQNPERKRTVLEVLLMRFRSDKPKLRDAEAARDAKADSAHDIKADEDDDDCTDPVRVKHQRKVRVSSNERTRQVRGSGRD